MRDVLTHLPGYPCRSGVQKPVIKLMSNRLTVCVSDSRDKLINLAHQGTVLNYSDDHELLP